MGNELEATDSTVAKIEQCCSSFSITPGFIKLLCGFTAASFFGVGIRSAWNQTRGAERREHLTRVKVLSGVGFASRALATATVISVSGFSLLIVGVSALLNVNSPRQFGDRMKAVFGDSLRISKKDADGQSITSLTELFEQAAAQPKPVEVTPASAN
uniref:Transmembrane protein 242 n=1 Tax=Steinernema glaseri TaxID=37863 RepID=A0A1I8A5R1_9BILA